MKDAREAQRRQELFIEGQRFFKTANVKIDMAKRILTHGKDLLLIAQYES
jgi:hypothetical protein